MAVSVENKMDGCPHCPNNGFFQTCAFVTWEAKIPPKRKANATSCLSDFALVMTHRFLLSVLFHPRTMPSIAEGVDFDGIAREWRCKWSEDNDKASLVAAQKELDAVLAELKAMDGVKSVQRIVCGGCHDLSEYSSSFF